MALGIVLESSRNLFSKVNLAVLPESGNTLQFQIFFRQQNFVRTRLLSLAIIVA